MKPPNFSAYSVVLRIAPHTLPPWTTSAQPQHCSPSHKCIRPATLATSIHVAISQVTNRNGGPTESAVVVRPLATCGRHGQGWHELQTFPKIIAASHSLWLLDMRTHLWYAFSSGSSLIPTHCRFSLHLVAWKFRWTHWRQLRTGYVQC